MENIELTITDLLIESHIGLERQGPGSTDIIIKALSFMDNINNISRTVDLACGTGGQTMVLAQNITGNIIGVDICPDFIDVFNNFSDFLSNITYLLVQLAQKQRGVFVHIVEMQNIALQTLVMCK